MDIMETKRLAEIIGRCIKCFASSGRWMEAKYSAKQFAGSMKDVVLVPYFLIAVLTSY